MRGRTYPPAVFAVVDFQAFLRLADAPRPGELDGRELRHHVGGAGGPLVRAGRADMGARRQVVGGPGAATGGGSSAWCVGLIIHEMVEGAGVRVV